MLIKSSTIAACALLWAAPCSALTHYVAAGGTGSSNCTVASQPCPTISSALSNATANDTILCLATPQTSAISINISITIDCAAARAQVRDNPVGGAGGTPTTGVLINATGSYQAPSGAPATDSLRTVRLRGLTIDGGSANSEGRSFGRGIEIQSAAVVYIEDCLVLNTRLQGIYDHRTGGQTRLYVNDSIITGNGGSGIVAASQGTAATVLDNVSLLNNAYGLATATGNNVVITRSTISGNTTAGVEADPGSQVNLLNSVLSHNTTNVQAFGTVRLRENDIQFSNVAVQGSGAISMGGNRFSGNGTIGSTPPLATGAPADVFN